jgi:alkylated DNA repair dioxygenase AlkB
MSRVCSIETLNLPNAEIFFYPGFFSGSEADRLFLELRDTMAWRQETFKRYGRIVPFPRLTAWYGDQGSCYVYSGIKNTPLPWTPAILEVKRAVEPPSGVVFNSVLVNRYRTGKDSVSWHADDEPEFGENPVIASVSFGGTRTFQLKHKKRKDLKAGIELTHGSLLVMRGGTQAHWLHQIPKTAKQVEERLNLTFRAVIASRVAS